jgi:hypothetical protein
MGTHKSTDDEMNMQMQQLADLDDELGMPRILADLADGNLSDEEANSVADWLMSTADDEPPGWVVNRAVRIAGQAVGKDAPRPSIWRRLVAALVYDNRLQPRVTGARAVAIEHPRLCTKPAALRSTLR